MFFCGMFIFFLVDLIAGASIVKTVRDDAILEIETILEVDADGLLQLIRQVKKYTALYSGTYHDGIGKDKRAAAKGVRTITRKIFNDYEIGGGSSN